MNEPKFLILTTNRTEDGAPVYAPCGDVRELIAKWLYEVKRIKEQKLDRHPVYREWAERNELHADQLEVALQPFNVMGDLLVARALQIGVEYPKEEVKQ